MLNAYYVGILMCHNSCFRWSSWDDLKWYLYAATDDVMTLTLANTSNDIVYG